MNEITSKAIEEHARRLAIANGHKDTDAEIVCVSGKRVPVWWFYRDAALDDLVRC